MSSLLATSNSATETTIGAPVVEPSVTQVGTSDATDWEKRYKDLQSFHDRETAKLRTDLKTAQNSTFTPPSSMEDIEAFKVEHPDLFNMIQTLSDQRAQSRSLDVSTQIDTLAKDSQTTKADMARAAILKAHPDFAGIVNSPEFRIWATEQDTSIQDGIYRNPDNAKLAIAVLDMYKAAVVTSSKNSSSSQDAASAADAINTGSSQAEPQGDKIWKLSEVKALKPAQFEKLEDEIDKAWDEGRIDLSQ